MVNGEVKAFRNGSAVVESSHAAASLSAGLNNNTSSKKSKK